jgi:lipooligosaccharide transport system permease protein
MTSAPPRLRVGSPGRPSRRRLRWGAVAAILAREWLSFTRVWRTLAVGSVVEPVLYLVGFGYGFGALVTEVAGIPYLDYMATGAAAIAVLFTSSLGAAFNGFFRRTSTHLYDALLGTPIGVAEIVTGEAAWTGVRAAGAAVVTMAVAWAFGVHLVATVTIVPLIAWLAGFGFACLFAAFGARLRSPQQFPFLVSAVFLPLFLVSWAFFPMSDAPVWLRWPSSVNPMTHLVALFRAAALGVGTPAQVSVGLGVLVTTAGLSWMLAVRWLGRAVSA